MKEKKINDHVVYINRIERFVVEGRNARTKVLVALYLFIHSG